MNSANTIQANAGRPLAFLLLETHPDSGCFTDQIRFRHKAPVTAVRRVIAVVTHHEVVSRRHNPGRQLLAWLLVVHCQLVLCDWHGQNAVSDIAQRLFAFNQTNTVLFGFTFWHLEESAGRFTAITAGEGLHKITWLNVGVRPVSISVFW